VPQILHSPLFVSKEEGIFTPLTAEQGTNCQGNLIIQAPTAKKKTTKGGGAYNLSKVKCPPEGLSQTRH
jgi:hypothetical protein